MPWCRRRETRETGRAVRSGSSDDAVGSGIVQRTVRTHVGATCALGLLLGCVALAGRPAAAAASSPVRAGATTCASALPARTAPMTITERLEIDDNGMDYPRLAGTLTVQVPADLSPVAEMRA